MRGAGLWLDVEALLALAEKSYADGLHAAVTLYRGDFLDGFYDEWIVNERYRPEKAYSREHWRN